MSQTFFLLPDGVTVDVGDPPEGAAIVDPRADCPLAGRKLTVAALADMIRLHGARHDGGVRANLRCADLTQADLRCADLSGANLTGANLTEADLTQADLSEADLTEADLTRANLTGADLTRANLTGADLTRANLTGAVGITSVGPVGGEGRVIYGVRHASGPMIQAGCSWATAADTIAAIEARYADGTGRERYRESYIAAVRWIVAELEVSDV